MTLFFEIGDAGRLIRVDEELEIISACIFQRIRVVGFRDRVWHIDPNPREIQIDREWCLWAWEVQPLAMHWPRRGPDQPCLLVMSRSDHFETLLCAVQG